MNLRILLGWHLQQQIGVGMGKEWYLKALGQVGQTDDPDDG